MKKYTHAWIAFKAVERLTKVKIADANKPFADFLLNWFESHKDGVIRGSWYPDQVIKDNSTSHIFKLLPAFGSVEPSDMPFRVLPSTSLQYQLAKSSALRGKNYCLDQTTNLPDRCEALSHAVIDNLRIRDIEEKGSPLSPTDNHIALLLFMLSHYVADAHMPMHCDSRPDEYNGYNLHCAVEEVWEREVVKYYDIDRFNQRFRYTPLGFPLLKNEPGYNSSILKEVEDNLAARDFQIGYGEKNGNVREYMEAVCQYSYLVSYLWFPAQADLTTIKSGTLEFPDALSFRKMSVAALADAVDSISRVWLRDLRRFMKWQKDQE